MPTPEITPGIKPRPIEARSRIARAIIYTAGSLAIAATVMGDPEKGNAAERTQPLTTEPTPGQRPANTTPLLERLLGSSLPTVLSREEVKAPNRPVARSEQRPARIWTPVDNDRGPKDSRSGLLR